MSLLDRLIGRADNLAIRVEHLRKDLAETEDELQRVAWPSRWSPRC